MKSNKIFGPHLFMYLFMCLGLSLSTAFLPGCAPGQAKNKVLANPGNNTQQKAEQGRLQKELADQQSARAAKIFVGHSGIEISSIDTDKITARITLDVNGKLRPLVDTIPVNNNLAEQSESQDKTASIQDLVPNSIFEISTYRFSAGSVKLLAFSYRLQHPVVGGGNQVATQMVFMILDPSLGSTAVKKTQFDFPSTRDLKTWAIEALDDIITK
jgi:hypothetical protein